MKTRSPGPCGSRLRAAGVLGIAILSAVAAGCASPRGAGSHERPLATSELGLSGTPYPVPADGWWHALQDPQLDQLVATALARNPGLAGALARVRVAREQAQIVGALEAPQVALDGNATRTHLSANYIYPPPFGGSTWWDGRLGLTLNWNLDFWGRQAALVEQAAKSADAVALDAAGSELLLSGALAQAYVDYARALQSEQLALRAQSQRKSLLDLTAQRVHAGLDTNVELRLAEGNLALTAVEIEQARLAAEAARHAIAALTGGSAADFPALAAPSLDFERALPLPEALPADLLARRPDVRASRLRIEAATAGRSAAHANFYPNVNIAAFAGFSAIGLDQLLQADSVQLSAGPALHLPVFDAGRLQAEYRRSGAELDAAIASYNETVLRAVREAADQASRLRSLDTQLVAQQRALESAEQAYSFAAQRYEAGLSSQLTVLNAETQVLAARRQRLQLQAERSSARIALLVALGGHLFQES